MDTKRELKKRQAPKAGNEWLTAIEALDVLMARYASEESTRLEKPLIDGKTLAAVNAAYAATLRYYTALLGGGKHDLPMQKEISRLWQKAGTGLRRLDPFVAAQLKASNPFWSQEVTWEAETIQKAWLCLNSIRISTNVLSPDHNVLHRWSQFSMS